MSCFFFILIIRINCNYFNFNIHSLKMTKSTSKKVFATNRKANFQYTLLETFEAGLSLLGSEVKAIREGKVNIKESYVKIFDNELFVVGMNIGDYSHKGYSGHNPLREKKILLHKKEIYKIVKDVNIKGNTIVPTKIYLKNAKIKIQISIAKGKKIWDKRESKKEKDIKRNLQRINRR